MDRTVVIRIICRSVDDGVTKQAPANMEGWSAKEGIEPTAQEVQEVNNENKLPE